MKFFDGCRPSLYVHGGRLYKDAKTGSRLWRLTLVITLKDDEIRRCDDLLQSAYQTVEAEENRIGELKLTTYVIGQQISFFTLPEAAAPAFIVGSCDLYGLRITRVEELNELWVTLDHELTDALHGFVKQYCFTRVWAAFEPAQLTL